MPLIITRADHGRDLVTFASRAAQALGIRPQMTLAHAKALVPLDQLLIAPHRPDRDALAMQALARWCARIAPIVGIEPHCTLVNFNSPDTLVMDITGCDRLYANPSVLARRIAKAISRRCETHARVAIAPSIGAACAMARYHNSPASAVTPLPGESPAMAIRQAVGPLPLAALRLDAGVLHRLHEVGLCTIDQLLAIARRSLHLRYGHELITRIDQLLGDVLEPITPIRPCVIPGVTHQFDGPVTDINIITHNCTRLLTDLLAELDTRSLGIRQLHVILRRLGQRGRDTVRYTVTLSRPSRSCRHIWSMLADNIGGTHLGFGVESIELIARRTGHLPALNLSLAQLAAPTRGRQDGGAEPASDVGNATELVTARLPPPDPAAAAELIDLLTARLGPERTLRPLPRSSHHPCDDAQLRPLSLPVAGDHFALPTTQADRPPLLLDPPEQADVIALVPDGPPMQVTWRSRTFRVINWCGPERLANPWWLLPMPITERKDQPKHPRSATAQSSRPSAAHPVVAAPRSPPPAPPMPALPQVEHSYFRAALDTGLWVWLRHSGDPQGSPTAPHVPAPARWHIHGIWV